MRGRGQPLHCLHVCDGTRDQNLGVNLCDWVHSFPVNASIAYYGVLLFQLKLIKCSCNTACRQAGSHDSRDHMILLVEQRLVECGRGELDFSVLFANRKLDVVFMWCDL